MKTLLLMRHAKSSWDDPTRNDRDRPLNKRGLKAAPLIGQFMRKRRLRPDLVVSSPAKRAAQTAALVMEHGRLTAELRLDERIYAASATDLLAVLARIEDSANEVLLVGHNPGIQDLLECLTSEPERFPTAALARVTLQAETWRDLREGACNLEWIVRPKELESR
jgi:phosphohistidine phosphatase